MSSRRDQEMQAKPTTTKRLAVEAYYRTSWAKGAPVPDVQPFNESRATIDEQEFVFVSIKLICNST